MASVREELVEFIIDWYATEPEDTEKAVDKAIEMARPQMEKDIEDVAEHIYSTQEYWD
jgi:hypothetical protein